MHNLRTFFLVLLIVMACAVSAGAADKVTCYTTWDDYFFYAAFEVQDPDVVSNNTSHMSKPWEDDCVEVYFQTDNKKADKWTPNTYAMSVSAGGGSSFLVDKDGKPVPKTIYTFKYSRRILGTVNRPNDKDLGYIVELAIPWKEMGGNPPSSGQIMGFNVICRLKGENTGFVSLSPDVKTEEDINTPAKWSMIKLSEVPSIVAIEDGAIVSRKVRNRAPLIDGTLSANEWVRSTSMQIEKPIPPAVMPRQMYMMENLVLSHYFYWYQGDKRKEAPYAHIINSDGSDALTDHPLDGNGFWLSHDRVQWHKDQLESIRNAGIDVVIPVYWGSTSDKKSYAGGLNCMVQALKEMKAEKQSYPLVGMFFDTTAMMVQYGANPDLTNSDVKETFYGMIKDFFIHVPDVFLASIQLPAEKGGTPAYIVVLYTGGFFSGMDNSFVEYCNNRFAQDFNGRKLIWVGGSDFKANNVTLDGYCDYGAGLGLKFNDGGWIDVAGVGAGYDDSAVPGRTTPIRSRMNGDTYKKDWDALMLKNPNWVIVDGWNELHEGSDILPSMEYGDRYVGLTRINTLRFNGMRDFDAKYLKHDTPQTMAPGATYQVTLTVKNAGKKPWYPGQGIFLGGRWFKDGSLYADSGARLPIQESVLAGQTMQKTMGIRVVDQDGKPLPEGDYELRWDMMRGRDEWFSGGGDIPLCVNVKVSVPANPAFTVVDSTAPALMKSGAVYTVILKIRNDGPSSWKANSKIGYRWYKASVKLGNASAESLEQISANESAAVLPADVDPGRVVEITVPVSVTSADGSALPAWKQDDVWTYLLKWDLNDGEKWIASPGTFTGVESVKVTSTDYGPKFISSDTPKEMNAGKKYSVNITLQNTGTDVWTKSGFKVGYHWCGFDGAEIDWDGMKTSLPKDVKPGETVTVKASASAPNYDGQYYLIWDLAIGDKWASSTANTRGGDIQMDPVVVSKGKLTAADLSKLYDTDIISYDTNPKDGDVDGAGASLPAEMIPALLTPANGDMWPCAGCIGAKRLPSERISFLYPSKLDGAKNAITCNGQTIPLKSGKYKAVHILAISTQDTTANIGLAYKDRNAPAAVQFSAWGEAPVHGEHAAFKALHRNSPSGDQKVPAYINHYEIAADQASELTSLVLPDNPAVKILAVTLEKAD